MDYGLPTLNPVPSGWIKGGLVLHWRLRRTKEIFMSAIGRGRAADTPEVERNELRLYVGHLRPGMTAFDVGSHVGFATHLFSRLVGDTGRVHAFEASKREYDSLVSMCSLARRRNVVLNHAAMSDHDGQARLFVYDREHAGWNALVDRPLHLYGSDARPENVEDVPCVTVDSYCSQRGIDHIDLLKIDVEGAEYQVLLGARKMLAEHRIACCAFEFGQASYDMGNDPKQIETLLYGSGYRLRNVVRGNPCFPGRGSAKNARFSMHVAVPKRNASPCLTSTRQSTRTEDGRGGIS